MVQRDKQFISVCHTIKAWQGGVLVGECKVVYVVPDAEKLYKPIKDALDELVADDVIKEILPVKWE